MKIITGNILDVAFERGAVVCHQVNCMKRAGSGLALQIRNRWKNWYPAFKAHNGKLGDFHLIPVKGFEYPNGSYRIVIIANLYGQFGYGRTGVHTNYQALERALVGLVSIETLDPSRILIPVGMGAGLAGGDWGIILEIIERVVPQATLVKWGGK